MTDEMKLQIWIENSNANLFDYLQRSHYDEYNHAIKLAHIRNCITMVHKMHIAHCTHHTISSTYGIRQIQVVWTLFWYRFFFVKRAWGHTHHSAPCRSLIILTIKWFKNWWFHCYGRCWCFSITFEFLNFWSSFFSLKNVCSLKIIIVSQSNYYWHLWLFITKRHATYLLFSNQLIVESMFLKSSRIIRSPRPYFELRDNK